MAELMHLASSEAGADPHLHSQEERRGPEVDYCMRQRPDPGEASFAVMTEDELAPLLLPASASGADIRAVLELHGMCLLTGVLSQAQCEVMERLWLNDLLQLVDEEQLAALPALASEVEQVQQGGPRAWPNAWGLRLGKKGTGSQRGLPHGGFAWAARLHPTVRRSFAAIYDLPEDELAVGLDCVFWRAADAPPVAFNEEWLHCDQNHCTGMTWRCIQGALYVWPSQGEASSTTVVWPGSHHEAYDLMMGDPHAQAKGSNPGGQSVKLRELASADVREPLLAQALAGARRVPCPAGSLLLWDSRTIHQGWGSGPRLAQPVCWEPRERRSKAALGRKLWMCCAGVPSSHSSSEGRVHGMATRQRPAPSWPADGKPALRDTLLPYGVAPGKEEEWLALMEYELWRGRGDPRQNAGRGDSKLLAGVLREEVVSAL